MWKIHHKECRAGTALMLTTLILHHSNVQEANLNFSLSEQRRSLAVYTDMLSWILETEQLRNTYVIYVSRYTCRQLTASQTDEISQKRQKFLKLLSTKNFVCVAVVIVAAAAAVLDIAVDESMAV